ncbi:raffinose synthase or seed imbibition protein Sip1-domain-containing protein [Paraphysoderma sedebokerense]|nr:raffinose synthase or seed imbibition protein Sip1-domain-containing protein [Paraphysoderma sedebokerense]
MSIFNLNGELYETFACICKLAGSSPNGSPRRALGSDGFAFPLQIPFHLTAGRRHECAMNGQDISPVFLISPSLSSVSYRPSGSSMTVVVNLDVQPSSVCLWTNAATNDITKWSPIPLSRSIEAEDTYNVTFKVPDNSGQYEFTVFAVFPNAPQQVWASSFGENGRITVYDSNHWNENAEEMLKNVLSIEPSPSFTSYAPQAERVHHHNSARPHYSFLDFDVRSSSPSKIVLHDLVQYTFLRRKSVYWFEPYTGKSKLPVGFNEIDIVWLLFRNLRGQWVLIVPIFGPEDRSGLTLKVNSGNELVIRPLKRCVKAELCVGVLEAEGSVWDLFSLLPKHIRNRKCLSTPRDIPTSAILSCPQELSSQMADRLKLSPPPSFHHYLGFCTWDAFYTSVSHDGLISALYSLGSANIPVSYIIIDDGWQSTQSNDKTLKSFDPDPVKFSSGMHQLIKDILRISELKWVGVWHSILGYWRGIDPNGELAKQFKLRKVHVDGEMWIIHEDDVGRFYDVFYSILKSWGVAFVKVDGQAILEQIDSTLSDSESIMIPYLSALRIASAKHFSQDSVIYCMAHSPPLIFSRFILNSEVEFDHNTTGPFLRNSDDFFPKDLPSHSWHIYTNSINNLFTSTFVSPDWDMFQSSHQYAEIHAVSRVFNGTLFYICDLVDRHNPTLLRRCIARDDGLIGTSWQRPALPSMDCFFRQSDVDILKLTNVSFRMVQDRLVKVGAVLAFNLTDSTKMVTISPSEVAGFMHSLEAQSQNEHTLPDSEISHVVYSYKQQKPVSFISNILLQNYVIQLRPQDFDIFYFIPVSMSNHPLADQKPSLGSDSSILVSALSLHPQYHGPTLIQQTSLTSNLSLNSLTFHVLLRHCMNGMTLIVLLKSDKKIDRSLIKVFVGKEPVKPDKFISKCALYLCNRAWTAFSTAKNRTKRCSMGFHLSWSFYRQLCR